MPTGVQISGLTFLNFVNTDAKIPIQLTGTTYHINYSAITDNVRKQGFNTSADTNYSHSEGYLTTAGVYGYHSSSIVDGIITLDSSYGNVFENIVDVNNIITLDDSIYSDAYGIENFVSTGITFDGTNTVIGLSDSSVNTSEAIIAAKPGYITNYNFSFGQHSEGFNSFAIGRTSHAEGYFTEAIGRESHSEGISSAAIGQFSHAEGESTAQGYASHSEGDSTTSIGQFSHAEGSSTDAVGEGSHAEGDTTQSIGDYSHAEGRDTISIGDSSHSGGFGTVAEHNYQTVVGRFNTTGVTSSDTLFVIGNGAATDPPIRSDLFIANLTGITINGVLTVTGVTSMVSRVVTNISIGTSGNFYNITTAGDYYVDSCNSGGVDNFVQFPSAVPLVGQQILIVNRVGDTFTVTPFGGEKIYQKADTSAEFSTMTARTNATFKSDGVDWYQVA